MSDRPEKKCPQCGWKSQANEVCGACGALFAEEAPDLACHSSAR